MTQLTTDTEVRTEVVTRPWASFSSWMATASTHLGSWSIVTLAFMTGAVKPLEFGDKSLFFQVLGMIVILIIVTVLITKSELFEFRTQERVVTLPPRPALFEEEDGAPHPADEQLASREEEIPPVAALVAGAPESGHRPDNGRRNGHRSDGLSSAPRDDDVSSAPPPDGQSDVVADGDKTRTT